MNVNFEIPDASLRPHQDHGAHDHAGCHRAVRAAHGEGGSGDDVQAGLSCFIERHGGVELVGHSGDQNGFISHLYFHRPSKSGYIVSFNTDVTSKRDQQHTTRAVDDDLRDAIAKEFWTGGSR